MHILLKLIFHKKFFYYSFPKIQCWAEVASPNKVGSGRLSKARASKSTRINLPPKTHDISLNVGFQDSGSRRINNEYKYQGHSSSGLNFFIVSYRKLHLLNDDDL